MKASRYFSDLSLQITPFGDVMRARRGGLVNAQTSHGQQRTKKKKNLNENHPNPREIAGVFGPYNYY